MGSAKQQTAISKVYSLLQEWDKGSRTVRKQILTDFTVQNQNKTGPELEAEFAQSASLFLTRITAWLRLTYMIGTCLSEQLRALQVFLSASSGHKFLAEFLEVGGVLTVLEILGLKQGKEEDKLEALHLLTCVANAGRKYKELICESYGIRAIAECLAKSRSEQTQECARNLLQTLAQGNPKFEVQVYKGLIALLPCSSPKAQQMAAQTLRVIQPIVGTANPSIVDPLLNLLKTLHLEVQYEAIELIKDLMHYDVQDDLLKGLVVLLRPAKEDLLRRPDILGDPDVPKMRAPLPVFVQQAAAAKAIGESLTLTYREPCNLHIDTMHLHPDLDVKLLRGILIGAASFKRGRSVSGSAKSQFKILSILARESNELAEKLIQKRAVHQLMYAAGNIDYADSQRQASISLEYLCRNYPIVDSHVKEAMGETLYDLFMSNPETLYVNMSTVQADVLVSNKINIPGVQ